MKALLLIIPLNVLSIILEAATLLKYYFDTGKGHSFSGYFSKYINPVSIFLIIVSIIIASVYIYKTK